MLTLSTLIKSPLIVTLTSESIDRMPELKFESPNDADVKVTRGFYDEEGRLKERWAARDSWKDYWTCTTYGPPGSLIGTRQTEEMKYK